MATGTRRDFHADKPGALEEGVELAHDGERFDPGKRAEPAAFADEPRGETGSAIRRMQDDPADGGDLRVVNLPLGPGPPAAESEEVIPAAERLSRGGKDADADMAITVAQDGDLSDAGDVMTAIVPAGKRRPVGGGADDGFEVAVE